MEGTWNNQDDSIVDDVSDAYASMFLLCCPWLSPLVGLSALLVACVALWQSWGLWDARLGEPAAGQVASGAGATVSSAC